MTKLNLFQNPKLLLKNQDTGGLSGWWTWVQAKSMKKIAMLGIKSQNGAKFKTNLNTKPHK